MNRFLLFDPQEGFSTYATEEARNDAARAAISAYHGAADGFWDDDVERLVVGEITARAILRGGQAELDLVGCESNHAECPLVPL